MNGLVCIMYYSTLCLYNARAGYSTEGGGGVKGVRSSIQYRPLAVVTLWTEAVVCRATEATLHTGFSYRVALVQNIKIRNSRGLGLFL